MLASLLTRARRRARRAGGGPPRDVASSDRSSWRRCRCCRSARSWSPGCRGTRSAGCCMRQRSEQRSPSRRRSTRSTRTSSTALPAAVWLGWIGQWSGGGMIALVSIAPLLFPTGRLPSRRWRPALWVGIAAELFLSFGGAAGAARGSDVPWQPDLECRRRARREPGRRDRLVPDAASVRGRNRGARSSAGARRPGRSREQIRLLIRAAIVVAVAFTVCLIWSFAAPAQLRRRRGRRVALAGVPRRDDGRRDPAPPPVRARRLRQPLARLHRADRRARRALRRASCSGSVGCSGQNASLEVALPATVAVAVAFQPVRDRLQRSVNRLLYGQRDEPYAAISSLGRRLGEAIGQTEVLSAMVETIADALRLPYVAVELASPAGPAAVHGTPAAGVALRLPLVHGGERGGDAVDRRPRPRRGARRRPTGACSRTSPATRRRSRERDRALDRGATLAGAARHRARGGAAATQRRPPRRSRPDARRRDPDDRGRPRHGRPRPDSRREAARPCRGEPRDNGRRRPPPRLRATPARARPARPRRGDPPAGGGAVCRRRTTDRLRRASRPTRCRRFQPR